MTAKIIQHQFCSEATVQNTAEEDTEKSELNSAADVHHSTIERLFTRMDIELVADNQPQKYDETVRTVISELPMSFDRSRTCSPLSTRRARQTVSRFRECINSVQGLRIAVP